MSKIVSKTHSDRSEKTPMIEAVFMWACRYNPMRHAAHACVSVMNALGLSHMTLIASGAYRVTHICPLFFAWTSQRGHTIAKLIFQAPIHLCKLKKSAS